MIQWQELQPPCCGKCVPLYHFELYGIALNYMYVMIIHVYMLCYDT